MIDKIKYFYGDFHDAIITEYIFKPIYKANEIEIVMQCYNIQKDFYLSHETIKITFMSVQSFSFFNDMEEMNFMLFCALFKQENGVVTFDFFPTILNVGIEENPDSEFKIKCKAIEYSVVSENPRGQQ